MARKKPGGLKKRSGDKKHGRTKRKAARKGSALSLFVRGRISAAEYWRIENFKPLKLRG